VPFSTAAEYHVDATNLPEIKSPSSPFLRLPSELRVKIYRSLFTDQRVTIHRPPDHSSHQNPCAIMQTCRLCYIECLPIFYELATITLRKDAFLYVLRRRIGFKNMARVRNIVVGGFDGVPGDAMATYLPDSLQKLVIRWKTVTKIYIPAKQNPVDDARTRSRIGRMYRRDLNECVTDLWRKHPNLRIYLEGIEGDDVMDKVGCPCNASARDMLLSDRHCLTSGPESTNAGDDTTCFIVRRADQRRIQTGEVVIWTHRESCG
jgi:hypothetical protein